MKPPPSRWRCAVTIFVTSRGLVIRVFMTCSVFFARAWQPARDEPEKTLAELSVEFGVHPTMISGAAGAGEACGRAVCARQQGAGGRGRAEGDRRSARSLAAHHKPRQ